MAQESKRAAEPHTTPRWVKVLGITAAVLVVLAGLAMVAGIGGSHGPWRHSGLSQPQNTSTP